MDDLSAIANFNNAVVDNDWSILKHQSIFFVWILSDLAFSDISIDARAID
jgi:hypothetical protein